MTAYNYQCAGCSCTLYADPLPEDEEDYCWGISGELCSSCQAQQSVMQEEHNNDD